MERRYSFLVTRWRDMLIMIQVLDPFEQFETIPHLYFPQTHEIGLQ